MRTEEWSVTAWQTWDGLNLRPLWGSDCGSKGLPNGAADPEPSNAAVGCFELYSHVGDDGMAPAAFDGYENTNLAQVLSGFLPFRVRNSVEERKNFLRLLFKRVRNREENRLPR
jgi:hypothetical protein